MIQTSYICIMKTSSQKRRITTARQIEAAMQRKGLSRSELAKLMGRNRSDVTKWLSGEHNFTNDLLSEISDVLGEEITGVQSLVHGYTDVGNIAPDTLQDITAGVLRLDLDTYSQAETNARKIGMDIRSYICSLVQKDSINLMELPKVDFSKITGRTVKKYAGYLEYKEVNDERFERIWNK